jgi:precorrin-8X/cobalt-precorrin-8 methylmutase
LTAAAQFDVHVVVDWSAASAPKLGPDSIWCAVAGFSVADVVADPVDLATRREAIEFLDRLVGSLPDRRILVGFDFPFGYPTGTARALGLAGMPWRSTWDLVAGLITDDQRNANNRIDVAARLNGMFNATFGVIEGPFWGCPVSRANLRLRTTKPASDGRIGEFRLCEQELRRADFRPFSVWQLAYPGSVGGQALVGLPVLASLLDRHRRRIEVWPFTTGLGPAPAASRSDAVVMAELWPSRFTAHRPTGRRRHQIKDAHQVLCAVDALAAADRVGALSAWLDPTLPSGARSLLEREEGWILGPPCGSAAVDAISVS